MAKKKYDWKLTAMKGVRLILPILFAGIASVYGDNPTYLALAPLIAMVGNTLKHKYNIDLKVI